MKTYKELYFKLLSDLHEMEKRVGEIDEMKELKLRLSVEFLKHWKLIILIQAVILLTAVILEIIKTTN